MFSQLIPKECTHLYKQQRLISFRKSFLPILSFTYGWNRLFNLVSMVTVTTHIVVEGI